MLDTQRMQKRNLESFFTFICFSSVFYFLTALHYFGIRKPFANSPEHRQELETVAKSLQITFNFLNKIACKPSLETAVISTYSLEQL